VLSSNLNTYDLILDTNPAETKVQKEDFQEFLNVKENQP
jgi:hypothetical protein